MKRLVVRSYRTYWTSIVWGTVIPGCTTSPWRSPWEDRTWGPFSLWTRTRGLPFCNRVILVAIPGTISDHSCLSSLRKNTFLPLGFGRLRDVISGLATDRKHDFLWVGEHEPTTSNVLSRNDSLCSWLLRVVWLDRARRAFIYANESGNGLEDRGFVV